MCLFLYAAEDDRLSGEPALMIQWFIDDPDLNKSPFMKWSCQSAAEWSAGALLQGFILKWNSRQEATEALFEIEYESNLRVKA